MNGFKCIQVHSKHRNFRKTEMIILSLNASTISDLPINLRLSHKRVSPLMTTHSSGKLVDARKYLTKLEIWIIANSLIPFWKKVTQVHAVQQMFVCFSHLRDAWITRSESPPTPFGSFSKIHPNLIIQASHDYSHWREIAQVCTLQQVIRKSWTFEKAFTHPFSG